jgi:hypothetical protein
MAHKTGGNNMSTTQATQCFLCGFTWDYAANLVVRVNQRVCKNRRMCLTRWIVNTPIGQIMPIYESALDEHVENYAPTTGKD